MFEKLIKVGEQLYKLNGFKLEEVAEGDAEKAVDLSEQAEKLAGGSLESVREAHTAKKQEFEELKKEAQSGSNEALAKQLEVQAELAVISGAFDSKKALIEAASAEAEDLPEEEKEEEITETEEGAVEETTETGTTETEEKVVEEAEKVVEEAAEAAEEKELVAATGSVSAENIADAQPKVFVTEGTLNNVVDGKLVRKQAEFVTASATPTIHRPKDRITDEREIDSYIADNMNDMLSTGRGLRQGETHEVTLGHFEVLTSPSIVDGVVTASGSLGASGGKTLGNENFTRGAYRHLEDQPAVLASGELCDEDERRTIPNCNYEGQDLTGLVQTYASPNCQLYYYKDIPLSAVKDGIGFDWDAQAYCDARDAYKEAVTADEPDTAAVSEALAALKIAEKNECAEAQCLPKEGPVVMEPIYRCLSWSIEEQDCNAEMIALHRRKLEVLFERALNSHFLTNIAKHSYNVTLDAADPANGFINADGQQLDASLVLATVLNQLSSIVQLVERMNDGNYSIIIPRGMMNFLALGQKYSAYENTVDDFRSCFSDYRIIETPDFGQVIDPDTGEVIDACPTPVGPAWTGYPEPSDGAAWVSGLDVANGGLAPIPWNTLLTPSDFRIYFADLSDFFKIQRPDVRLGAQITHESIKGNRVAAEFYETFVGYGKDGCHPSFTLDLFNLCSNGARVGTIAPHCFGQVNPGSIDPALAGGEKGGTTAPIAAQAAESGEKKEAAKATKSKAKKA